MTLQFLLQERREVADSAHVYGDEAQEKEIEMVWRHGQEREGRATATLMCTGSKPGKKKTEMVRDERHHRPERGGRSNGEVLVHGDEAREEENGEDSGREASLPGKTREGNGEVHVYALESQTDSLGRFVPPSTSAPAEVFTPQPSTGATAWYSGIYGR